MKKQNKEEAAEQEKQTVEENQSSQEQTEEVKENETEKEVQPELSKEEELEQKVADLNDKYLRLYSDFENFRKRTIKEKGDLISNASQGVLKDMLAVLDDFERAIDNNQTSEDAESIKQGFQLIYNKFNNILTAKGLKPMDSKGEVFDIDHHEAITNIPAEDDMKGKVVDVVEKGYFLNDKVLRYAKVVVGQ
ncbi:nucleotide exchange factor GrpE [Brumimicrobium aurantiacum]|uniref:Protein GrpE n=1 Tax=Brumimicrobium aurantiacum TaxID=1737063 RepID=A0A3E1EXM8_9FLAO|nr:nucleotide exchange factor GrpE [Brumimicrobium aurantiacum]RFC54309.1 nucleotide exchange factor GrpE [Brumimicrobium aurantiacum]